VTRPRPLHLYVCAVAALSIAGYAATQFLNDSAPAATPHSPYASQSPPDCDPPEKNPVPCGAYYMTCEEQADYYRRLNANTPGSVHVLVCAETEATGEKR
jgi:hypothetical protein